MSAAYTREKGPFRILIEPSVDPRNQYFEVTYYKAGAGMKSEILWVRDSRIAFNRSVRKHGNHLLNITNLETGRMVVGAKS